MKKDNNLKKHHFWILFGVVPLLVFIALILVMTVVGEAIAKQEGEITSGLTKLKSTQPKGKGLTEKLSKQQEELVKTRSQLWKANYERQVKAGIFDWPIPPNIKELKALEAKYQKFGEPMTFTIEDEQFKFTRSNVYEEAYVKLAESVAPTRMGTNGWRGVLRHVSDWSRTIRPDSNTMWLAIEDYWIQKALLKPIKEINDTITQFHLQTSDGKGGLVDYVPGQGLTEPPPLERTFRSRNWELNLKVVTENGKRLIKSRIRNRTDRLQILGMNKTMKLNIWVDNPATSQSFEYKIEGELVKGQEEIDVKLVPANHAIPPGTVPVAITKVEQILDDLTVPVRMVSNIEIGVLDHKRKATNLVPPSFLEEAAADPNAAEGMNPMGGGYPMGDPDGGGGPGFPGAGGSASAGAKYGTPQQVLLANKKRYLEGKTDQLRRIPVGVVLVLDWAYVDDAFIAYANSPVRFQLTMPQMTRFRGKLPALPAQPGVGGPGRTGPGTGPGSGTIPPPMGSPGGEGEEYYGQGGSNTSSSGLSIQGTAGLVELGLFGIITFYEQYKEDPDANKEDEGTKTEQPLPMEPKEPTEPKQPMPQDPMPPTDPKKSQEPMPMPMNPSTGPKPETPGTK